MAGERGLAENVRTRLDEEKRPALRLVDMNEAVTEKSYLDEDFHGKPVRYHIAQFGLMWLALFLLIGAYLTWRGSSYANVLSLGTTGLLLTWIGYRVPGMLYSVWKSWMKLAEILGLVMTPIVMTFLWCITFIPFGFGLKLLRIKVMNTEFRTDAKSYWMDRDKKKDEVLLFKNQF